MEMTKHDIYQKAIEAAKLELAQAERNLELVDPPLTVWAAHEVVAKQEKLNALFQLVKKELAG
jgi:hypothetical protein